MRELAAETGESLTAAITVAVRERLERVRGRRPARAARPRTGEHRRPQRRAADPRCASSADEILGYGAEGSRREPKMVVDTSALVAVLFGEPERDAFVDAAGRAPRPADLRRDAARGVDRHAARTGETGSATSTHCWRRSRCRPVAVDAAQAYLARDAFARFGKGRSPAGLNFGDCFSYALAQTMGRPLLFKGEDFARTDVMPAVTRDAAGPATLERPASATRPRCAAACAPAARRGASPW